MLRRLGIAFLALLLAGLVLAINGAIPGFGSPTLGQAVWTAGFAQSYANQSLLSIFATNFGAPDPAAISFGLAGAYPVAVLIFFGMHPADAYALMVAAWLLVAFSGAYALARKIGIGAASALLAATLWLCLPIVWVHAGYSMLELGIALLPTYLLSALLLMDRAPRSRLSLALRGLFAVACCLIAVLMDGYTFVMFAVAVASCLTARLLLPGPGGRRSVLRIDIPVYALGFGLAYVLYALFQGRVAFEGHPMEAFRGWGVDLTFLVQPTHSINWLADAASFSISRSPQNWFGDASVWTSTYVLPLLIAGVAAALTIRPRREMWLAFVLIAAVGFYFSLGPSLKINSQKPPELGTAAGMPYQYAIMPTGSSRISAYVPGFREMRAAYRWQALSSLGLWSLLILALVAVRQRIIQAAALALLVAIFVPNVPNRVAHTKQLRATFLLMEREILATFGQDLRPGETVAFLPYRNDFLVNYVAAKLDIRAYNIGGDKNLDRARQSWPPEIAELAIGEINLSLAERTLSLLVGGKADAVVLPFINMHMAANKWPYPPEFRGALQPVLDALIADPDVRIIVRDLYAIVRRAE
jgi:hypothetical protein